MKTLEIIFCVFFIIAFLFGKVKVNGSTDISIWERVLVCFCVSFLLTIILGLPVLGIIHLLGV